jgi:hypothetical protein
VASPTDGSASTTELNLLIADADAIVAIDTGETAASTNREVLVKAAATALWQEREKNRLAKGGTAVSGLINATLNGDPWATYKRLLSNYGTTSANAAPRYYVLRHAE